MINERTPIGCQYVVYTLTEEGTTNCNDPVVSYWDWGKGNCLYLCKEHDDLIQKERCVSCEGRGYKSSGVSCENCNGEGYRIDA